MLFSTNKSSNTLLEPKLHLFLQDEGMMALRSAQNTGTIITKKMSQTNIFP